MPRQTFILTRPMLQHGGVVHKREPPRLTKEVTANCSLYRSCKPMSVNRAETMETSGRLDVRVGFVNTDQPAKWRCGGNSCTPAWSSRGTVDRSLWLTAYRWHLKPREWDKIEKRTEHWGLLMFQGAEVGRFMESAQAESGAGKHSVATTVR